MTIAEYEAYISTIDEVENRIVDDDKYPVVNDYRIKNCCKYSLEVAKVFVNYLKSNIDVKEKAKSKSE